MGMLIARVDGLSMEMLTLGSCTYQGDLSEGAVVDLRQSHGKFKVEEGRLWFEAQPHRKQYLEAQQGRVVREEA